MKKLVAKLLVGIFSLGLCLNLSAEERKRYTFKDNDTQTSDIIILERGDKVVFDAVTDAAQYHQLRFSLTIEEGLEVREYADIRSIFNPDIKTYYGPLKIQVGTNKIKAGRWVVLTEKITRASEAQGKNVTGYSLVLPESKDTNYNLVLEGSTDLVNWTADTTGTKTPSGKKRFYRLRAVKE